MLAGLLYSGQAHAADQDKGNVVTAHSKKLAVALLSRQGHAGLLSDFASDVKVCMPPPPNARSVQCAEGLASVDSFFKLMFERVRSLNGMQCSQLDPDLYLCRMSAVLGTGERAVYNWGYRFAGEKITQLRLLTDPSAVVVVTAPPPPR